MAPDDRATRPSTTPSAPEDAFLLARARKGDASAFEEVVRRYQRRVYGVALRIVRAHDVADDVTQEAFLRAWRALDRFELGRPFGPWVCRIAANIALNHVRSPRAREEVLDRALASLPPEQRAVFVLRAFEELSYEEIAQALDLSAGTVMSRLFRARQRLVRALAPYLGAAAPPRKEGTG
jgi:RNA polymerase sigma-70 factor (ECF subfamily)